MTNSAEILNPPLRRNLYCQWAIKFQINPSNPITHKTLERLKRKRWLWNEFKGLSPWSYGDDCGWSSRIWLWILIFKFISFLVKELWKKFWDFLNAEYVCGSAESESSETKDEEDEDLGIDIIVFHISLKNFKE